MFAIRPKYRKNEAYGGKFCFRLCQTKIGYGNPKVMSLIKEEIKTAIPKVLLLGSKAKRRLDVSLGVGLENRG